MVNQYTNPSNAGENEAKSVVFISWLTPIVKMPQFGFLSIGISTLFKYFLIIFYTIPPSHTFYIN